MNPVWQEGCANWTRVEIWDLIKEPFRRTGGDVEDIVVPTAMIPTIKYEDEGEWYEEHGEEDDYRYELDQPLEGVCARFDVLTTITSRMDEFVRS